MTRAKKIIKLTQFIPLQEEVIKLKEENEKLKAVNKELAEALGLFQMLHLDNESNYPPGTIGHRLNELLKTMTEKYIQKQQP